jgi:DNA polymerase-3 subunit epsilon
MPNDLIAVVDLETTGLSPWRHDRIVEVGIVLASLDGKSSIEYDTLVNPQRDIGPSSIHKISASDVIKAPKFSEIAGDVLGILVQANAVAGHNVSFDMNFLYKEFERVGVILPPIPLLCTCRLFGRANLKACCDELGISFDGIPHRAISDARTTARIVSYCCEDDPSLLEVHRINNVLWPSLPALKTPQFSREHAQRAQNEPPRFLQRISSKIHHNVEAEPPNVLAYMALIDRVLEDRTIDAIEEETLVDAALNWRLSQSQLDTAHSHYLSNLAVSALSDGIVTDSERRDLHIVAKLLGQNVATLDALLETAATQLAGANCGTPKLPANELTLSGQSVCFTGELQGTINGEPITQNVAEAIATRIGMVVASNVTKKLDILVVADPNTQSGKAKKARDYGIRILSDMVFWRMAGVTVD